MENGSYCEINFLSEAYVVGLFGIFDYRISLNRGLDERNDRLTLIYGDNGSGKTTLVKLIHHCLSPRTGRNHRSFLSNTRFSEFGLALSNGSTICVKRKKGHEIGDYTMEFFCPGEPKRTVSVKASPRGDEYTVRGDGVDDDKLFSAYRMVLKEGLDTFLLTDNREFESDAFEVVNEEPLGVAEWRFHARGMSPDEAFRIERSSKSQISISIRRAENWMRRAALQARNANDTSISRIYSDLILNLANRQVSEKWSSLASKEQLINRLKKISFENQKLIRFGLSSELTDTKTFMQLLSSNDEVVTIAAPILEPYLDGVDAKISALSGMVYRLETIEDAINQFYKNKRIRINALEGISLEGSNSVSLSPDMLSSGEKHLLLIMCNVLVGTSGRSLFLIDEPELSLNVKWQRKLIDTLLDLSAGADVQFIMATHSIELLSKHKHCVQRL